MIREISKIGNSHGLILDSELMELAKLQVGDQMNVELHSGGAITLTPMRGSFTVKEVEGTIDSVMDEYDETMKNLAE